MALNLSCGLFCSMKVVGVDEESMSLDWEPSSWSSRHFTMKLTVVLAWKRWEVKMGVYGLSVMFDFSQNLI